MQEKLENIQHLIISDTEANGWRKQVEYRRTNKDWLKKSAKIAIKVLRVLREKKITQVQLAELLAVSPQHINKILKGRENLTLETIGKLESALDIELVTIVKADEKVVKSKEWDSMLSYYFTTNIKDSQSASFVSAECGENKYELAA